MRNRSAFFLLKLVFVSILIVSMSVSFIYADSEDDDYDSTEDISDAEIVDLDSYTYTGKKIKPDFDVELDDYILDKDADYSVSYKNNTNVGTATIIINGKGDYEGTLKATFKLIPKSSYIRNVKRYKKSIKVTWKKISQKMAKGRITGYQIQTSKNKSFTSGVKTKKVKGYTKTSYKITGLKSGKTYYVRIRTYRIVGDKTYYSKWSKYKKVKTKSASKSSSKSSGNKSGTVYWVDSGRVYHFSKDCPSLSRSHNIHSGTIAQSGRSRACKNCS